MTDSERQREWESAIIAEREARFQAEADRDAALAALAAARAEIAVLRHRTTETP